MKTLLALFGLAILASCHPPEMTTVKINAIDGSTEEPLDSLRCQILEGGVEVIEKYTLKGQTQMAFESRSNKSYELKVDGTSDKKFRQVENYGYNITLGQSNEYTVKFLRYGYLDLGLETLVATSYNDFLEYQLVNLDYNEVYPISNGWAYGEDDIYGPQNDPHFMIHEMPAGNYRLDYRVRRNGYYSNYSTNLTILPEQTTEFLLQY